MRNVKQSDQNILSFPVIGAIESQAQSLVASAPFPIGVYVGKDMRIQLVNQALLDVWGKGNDVIGKKYAEVLPELEQQNIFEQLDKVYQTGEPFHARNQRVDLVMNGTLETFYFNYSFTPLYDGDGKIYGVMNTAADVTDLQQARLQVERSSQNFRNMIMQAPVAMCIMTGPEHTVEIANEPMLRIWGKPDSEVMFRPIFEGLPDARDQGLEQLLEQVYRTGEAFSANERPVQLVRDGKPDTVYQNFVYQAYRDADGTILGVLAISMDVTDLVLARKQIEHTVAHRTASLAEANQQLQQSNADLAQFAHIASHDLQEPLRKISVYADRLEETLSHASEPQVKFLGRIKSSVEKMQLLVKEVLAYAEVSSGASKQFAPVDLNLVVKEVMEDFELVIEQKKAVVTVGQLPIVLAIRLQMVQLFTNLLSNALKYSRDNKPPRITITGESTTLNALEIHTTISDASAPFYVIKISDNGIGFDPENAEKIFQLFERLHTKSTYEGSGIGLSLCRKIAQLHGGDITAEATPGEGAIFRILIPVFN